MDLILPLVFTLQIVLTIGKPFGESQRSQFVLPFNNGESHFPFLPEVPCGSVKKLTDGDIFYFRNKETNNRNIRTPYWSFPQQTSPRLPPSQYPYSYFHPAPFSFPRTRPYQHIKPRICSWMFQTNSTCQLVANFEHYEGGDLNCNRQYILLSDEERELQVCGYAPFPGVFKAIGQSILIKHFRKPQTWSADFEGYVTCVPNRYPSEVIEYGSSSVEITNDENGEFGEDVNLNTESEVQKVIEYEEPKEYVKAQESQEPKYSPEKPKYAEEEPKYAEAEPKYAEEEPKYAEEEHKYAEEKPKYAEEEPKYAEEEPKYAEEEPKYAEEEPKSSEEEPKAAQEKSKYAQEKTKYVEEKRKYAEEKPKYAQEETKYSEEKPKYAEEKPKYAEEKPKYAEGKPQYVEEKPQYVEDKPQYAEDKPKYAQKEPKYAEEKPQYAEEKPQYAEEKPKYEEEKLQYAEEKFQYAEEKPKYEEEKPQYAEEKPKYEEEKLQYAEEKPKYEAEKPKYAEEDNKYAEEKPKYAQEEPKYAEDKPKYAEETSKYAEEEPKYTKEKPKYAEKKTKKLEDINIEEIRKNAQESEDDEALYFRYKKILENAKSKDDDLGVASVLYVKSEAEEGTKSVVSGVYDAKPSDLPTTPNDDYAEVHYGYLLDPTESYVVTPHRRNPYDHVSPTEDKYPIKVEPIDESDTKNYSEDSNSTKEDDKYKPEKHGLTNLYVKDDTPPTNGYLMDPDNVYTSVPLLTSSPEVVQPEPTPFKYESNDYKKLAGPIAITIDDTAQENSYYPPQDSYIKKVLEAKPTSAYPVSPYAVQTLNNGDETYPTQTTYNVNANTEVEKPFLLDKVITPVIYENTQGVADDNKYFELPSPHPTVETEYAPIGELNPKIEYSASATVLDGSQPMIGSYNDEVKTPYDSDIIPTQGPVYTEYPSTSVPIKSYPESYSDDDLGYDKILVTSNPTISYPEMYSVADLLGHDKIPVTSNPTKSYPEMYSAADLGYDKIPATSNPTISYPETYSATDPGYDKIPSTSNPTKYYPETYSATDLGYDKIPATSNPTISYPEVYSATDPGYAKIPSTSNPTKSYPETYIATDPGYEKIPSTSNPIKSYPETYSTVDKIQPRNSNKKSKVAKRKVVKSG